LKREEKIRRLAEVVVGALDKGSALFARLLVPRRALSEQDARAVFEQAGCACKPGDGTGTCAAEDDCTARYTVFRRLVEGMTEQEAHELLYFMRQRFRWYSEVFGRADIEERWDAEAYGPLTDEHLEAIIDRLERCDGYGAAERVSEVVDRYADDLLARGVGS
jgi:hypothetical protein